MQGRVSHRVVGFAALAGALLGLACMAAAARQGEPLGEIHFPTSGSPAAQADFERGVLLLHSFEYDDAAAAFREAERRQPGYAMAYWGEAMTYNHPLWHQQDEKAARAALARLAATPEARLAKAPTAREKAYLAAVEALYGNGDKAARDRLYAGAMERLAAGDPGDLEAASFCALALLGTCENGRDVPTYMRAAAVAEEVFARNPRHPGAVHYLIHAYDDPVHAPLGLRPARVYARIAPAAAHALHMPSHIFLALGMWDEVAASNVASWAASEDRRKRLGLSIDERGYHALSWLEYAYLQQGRFREARDLLATMAEDARRSGSPRTREHLALMQAGFRVETRAWTADLGELPGLTGLDDGLAAAALFAHGLAALETGDEPTARHDLERLGERQGGAGAALTAYPSLSCHPGQTGVAAQGSQPGIPTQGRQLVVPNQGRQPGQPGQLNHPDHAAHGGGEAAGGASAPGASAPTAPGSAPGTMSPAQRSAGILYAELAAMLRRAKAGAAAAGPEAQQAAVAALERAASDEDAMSYEFGPPVVVKPPHELAGELLLEIGRPAEARRHFEQALARAPRRSLSLLGLARAAARAGDAAAATRAYAELGRNWQRADADVKGLAELASPAAAR